MRANPASPRTPLKEEKAARAGSSSSPLRELERKRSALAACSCYAVSSVALSLVNKALFSDHRFDFPLSVLASQAFGTVLCLQVYAALSQSESMHIDLKLLRAMAPVTLLFAAMLGSSSRALRHCSVPVVTIFKNIAVALATVYEWRFHR